MPPKLPTGPGEPCLIDPSAFELSVSPCRTPSKPHFVDPFTFDEAGALVTGRRVTRGGRSRPGCRSRPRTRGRSSRGRSRAPRRRPRGVRRYRADDGRTDSVPVEQPRERDLGHGYALLGRELLDAFADLVPAFLRYASICSANLYCPRTVSRNSSLGRVSSPRASGPHGADASPFIERQHLTLLLAVSEIVVVRHRLGSTATSPVLTEHPPI